MIENVGVVLDQADLSLGAVSANIAPPKLVVVDGLKNKIATSKSVQIRLSDDLSRMNEANKERANSEKILGESNQNYSSTIAYQQAGSARARAIQDALNSDREAPSEKDVSSMVEQRKNSPNIATTGIPTKVLNNVQQSTGISPEEINELMNK
jgi:hypothetical protein